MADLYQIDAAKRELAFEMKAALLLARIRAMAQEVFPMHCPQPGDIREIVTL